MKRFALSLVVTLGSLAVGCGRSNPAPTPAVPDAPHTPNLVDAAAPTAAAVEAATEAPARALGLKLGFAYTANLMGELEPCG
jgi:hypothetical protein